MQALTELGDLFVGSNEQLHDHGNRRPIQRHNVRVRANYGGVVDKNDVCGRKLRQTKRRMRQTKHRMRQTKRRMRSFDLKAHKLKTKIIYNTYTFFPFLKDHTIGKT